MLISLLIAFLSSSFDVKKGEVVITNKGQLQKALRTSGLNKKEYKVTYNEVKDTVEKLNSVINSEAGEKFKSDILWELRQHKPIMFNILH